MYKGLHLDYRQAKRFNLSLIFFEENKDEKGRITL
jgi:hypothetical protein